jgi:prespore-specific regulator
MKMRQDAWTPEDDLLLAETVLRHIREGSTQLKAFDEVGDVLNRTSAACGFRWNAEVRQRYEEAVQIAKKQRKEMKRALAKQQKQTIALIQTLKADVIDAEFSEELVSPVSASSITITDVIRFLQDFQHEARDIVRLQTENDILKRENADLKQQNEKLQNKVTRLLEQQNIIQEDYQNLVRIMDRARKMVLLDEQEDRMAPIFKMDKNGNLEIISK